MSWILLISSGVLFSSGFLCNKLFQRGRGSGLRQAMEYLFFGSAVIAVTMPFMGKEGLEFSWFSFGMAAIYALNGFVMSYFGIQAFRYANLSVYSMFMMMGSIVIPWIVGIFIYKEALTLPRMICLVLILIALSVSVERGKGDKRAIVYYILVFTLNGMAGVISKIHQAAPELAVNSNSFLWLSGLIKLAACAAVLAVIYLRTGEKLPSLKLSACAVGGGLLNAVGNLFGMIALITIPIVIHSVMTTGMVLIGSALIGLFIGEKIKPRTAVSLVFALAATVVSVM